MNKSAVWIIGIIVGLVLIFGIASVATYNGLISSDEAVKQAWADVQSSYQRRMDLIPNLVATVQGAAKFESGTLTEVTALRA
ncbi:MAG TPA: LemA family protein, partial [Acidobacteriota bacterium]|nr:LemA family protein [Acidobacteriota bacterium]